MDTPGATGSRKTRESGVLGGGEEHLHPACAPRFLPGLCCFTGISVICPHAGFSSAGRAGMGVAPGQAGLACGTCRSRVQTHSHHSCCRNVSRALPAEGQAVLSLSVTHRTSGLHSGSEALCRRPCSLSPMNVKEQQMVFNGHFQSLGVELYVSI